MRVIKKNKTCRVFFTTDIAMHMSDLNNLLGQDPRLQPYTLTVTASLANQQGSEEALSSLPSNSERGVSVNALS